MLDMIMLNSSTITVRFIRWLKPDLKIGIYLLPDGRFVVGYDDCGRLEEHEVTPAEYAWAADE